jgi:hypothetical protein
MSDVYTESLKTQWNIDTYLKPLFKDVTGFRRVQAQTGTLLANHVARDFFLRDKLGNDGGTKWCHLIVQAGEDARTLISFLQGEGYIAVQVEEAEGMKKYGVSKACLARPLRTFRDNAN